MRVLMITAYIPYPPFSGNPLRNYNLLRRVAREHEVWLATFVRSPQAMEDIRHLLEFCQGVTTAEWRQVGALERPAEAFRYLLSGKPPDLRLYHSDRLIHNIKQLISKVDFDVIDIEDSFMGLYLDALPAEMHQKTVLTFHDVVFRKYDRISKLEPKPAHKLRTWLHSRMMRRWEPNYAGRFGECITVSETDSRVLLQANPRLKVSVVPNGVDTAQYQPLPLSKTAPALIFVGNMGYRPNIDAVTFFCREIYPRIMAEFPGVAFWIVGKNPSEEVIQLNGGGVHVTGQVDDLCPYYSRSTVCVVPLRAGGGTRLKILEAMALSRPVVTTSIGCEGLEVADGKHLLIADTPDQFAEKTLLLLADEGLRQRIAAQARELVVTRYDWDIIARRLMQVYAEVAG